MEGNGALPADYPTGVQVEKMFREAADAGVLPNGHELVDMLPRLGVTWESVAEKARASAAGWNGGVVQAAVVQTFICSYLHGLGEGFQRGVAAAVNG